MGSAHVCKHAIANLFVLLLDLQVVQRLALKVGNDVHALQILVRVDEVPWRLGTDERPAREDQAAKDLDGEWPAPRPVRLDVAARVVDPDGRRVANNVASKLERAEEAPLLLACKLQNRAHVIGRGDCGLACLLSAHSLSAW